MAATCVSQPSVTMMKTPLKVNLREGEVIWAHSSTHGHWFHCSWAMVRQSIVGGVCDGAEMLTSWQQETEGKGPGTRHTLQCHIPSDLPLPNRPHFLRLPPPPCSITSRD